MERTFKSQSQLPQRRWTLAGDAKASNGRCTSAKSSTLPKIANRPITALPSYRTSSGYLSATITERKASFPRERPKSAIVQSLSGRVILRPAHSEWQANGSKASMLCLEDFSDEEDDCCADTFEDEHKDTSLKDLLTCSALSVEAKARKPDWNVSDPLTPTFHCPRCRDHWYGFSPLPCDDVRAKLARGAWQRGREDTARGEEGRPKIFYRSKSARVCRTEEGKQNAFQSIEGSKGPSKGNRTRPSGMGSPLKRESPPLKSSGWVGFDASKVSIEQDGRDIKPITDKSREGDDKGIGDGSNADCDGHGTVHHTSGHVTDKDEPQSELPDNCNDVVTTSPLEHTRLQGPTDMLLWRRNGAPPLNANGDRSTTEGGQDTVANFEGHRNDKVVAADCFAASEEKELNAPTVVTNAPITTLNDDSRSGHLKTKVVDKHDSISPSNQAAPTNPAPSDHITELVSSSSEQYSSKKNSFSMPSVSRPRSGRRSETARAVDKRDQGGPLVPPIPLKRHTVDASDLIYSFKLTSPWTFSYHTPASPQKKVSVEQRSR